MTSLNADPDLWIRRYHKPRAGATRLVCFPYAGGGASYFFQLSRALAPDVEVLAVQYPGRQERYREACVEDIHLLAEMIHTALAPSLTGPYAFFGHSMGAVVAYEVARLCAERGQPVPVRLIVSGRRAPSRARDEWVHQRDDAGLLAELTKVGGTDPRVMAEPELLASVLPVLRSDYRAIETYRHLPAPPLACPVTVLTGRSDPQVDAEEAGAWQEHTTGDFELRTFSGGHFFLDEHRAEVARLIGETLISR
ncbi:MAG TPA: alpha/beta fold hydrolase [Streptomyces sp.]|nr:alpha/beta fold hydrolase [Streptomyces sp.]